MRLILIPLCLFLAGPVDAQDTISDGRKAFRVCQTCHTDVPGRNGFGPSLYGVVGRRAGSLPDYGYSDAMRQSRIVWDEATLEAFIAAPRDTVKGTKMPYPGMKDAAKRAVIIAYLKSLKD
jgi:cytochrome c2